MTIEVHQLQPIAQPRDWKSLERHPLSAEHDNINGDEWTNFVADLKEFGNIIGRPIILHDGKVIDGWQLQRAHIELDTKPQYVQTPEGVNIVDWVRILCDNRRHDDRKELLARHKAVLKARQEGKSIREIAKEQNVSPAAVQRAVKKTGAKVAEKVKGRDGKTYDTAKAKKTKAVKQAAKPKGFLVRYTQREFDQAYGPLLRQIDIMARSFEAEPNAQIFTPLRQSLGSFKNDFFAVYKDLLEKAKAKS